MEIDVQPAQSSPPCPRVRQAVQQKSSIADQRETARYIATMAVELRGLAVRAGHDMLAHLLDMVVEEAEDLRRQEVRPDQTAG
jgi:pyridoxine 5'-phosphate synthase PdxJ